MNEHKYRAFISYSHKQDRLLAEALERDLRRFARPWNRSWAVRVYRDVSNLAATPDLWASIESAIRDSAYFVLLASQAAASSKWVAKEVETFLTLHGADRLLIVLTDGEVVWDERASDFDWSRTSALPRSLRLPREPKFLDLRWALKPEMLHTDRWKDSIADLSSVLHNRPKDELFGQDVRQRRIQRGVLWSSIVTLVATPFILVGISIYFSTTSENVAAERIALIEQSNISQSSSVMTAEDAFDRGDYVESFRIFKEITKSYGPDTESIRARQDGLLNRVLKTDPSFELTDWSADWPADYEWLPTETRKRVERPLEFVAEIHREAKRAIPFVEHLVTGDALADISFSAILGEWTRSHASMGVGMALVPLVKGGKCVGSINNARIQLQLPEMEGGVEVMRPHNLYRLDRRKLLTIGLPEGISMAIRIGVVYGTTDGQLVQLGLDTVYKQGEEGVRSSFAFQSYSVTVCSR